MALLAFLLHEVLGVLDLEACVNLPRRIPITLPSLSLLAHYYDLTALVLVRSGPFARFGMTHNNRVVIRKLVHFSVPNLPFSDCCANDP